jgi:hypothetical protein
MLPMPDDAHPAKPNVAGFAKHRSRQGSDEGVDSDGGSVAKNEAVTTNANGCHRVRRFLVGNQLL